MTVLVLRIMTGKKAERVPRQVGFTLIELMVVLSIAAVLMAFALPAFNDFTQQRRMAASVNLWVSAVGYARSEATRAGQRVTLQALNGADADNEWGPGFCVTLGDPGQCDEPLRLFLPESNITLDGIDAYDRVDALGFDGRGLLIGSQAGRIEVCGEDADADPGRSIAINALGRTSIAEQVCYP